MASSPSSSSTGTVNFGQPRLILVSLDWPPSLFENEGALKRFVARAETAVRAVFPTVNSVTRDSPRVALVIGDLSQGPHVTVIGDNTETYGQESPLGSAVLAAVRAKL